MTKLKDPVQTPPHNKSKPKPTVKSKAKSKAKTKTPGDTWRSKHYLLEQRHKVQFRRSPSKVLYLYTTLCLTDLPKQAVRYCIHAGQIVRYYFSMFLCT